jgi:hypothetical protein
MPSSKVIEAIAVTAELCGRVFSPAAAMVFASDLDGFPDAAILGALSRCRKEVKGFLTIADVISRIDDGRPGAEEAWAMIPRDEASSVVWTEEMAQAYGKAALLLEEGDKIGARMAFKEAYAKLVAEARDHKAPPKWTPSMGEDVNGRQLALIDAVRAGRMGIDHAANLLAGQPDLQQGLLLQAAPKDHPLLAAPDQKGRAKVQALLADMRSSTFPKE